MHFKERLRQPLFVAFYEDLPQNINLRQNS